MTTKTYDLGYGHLGNGLTVWNRADERDGDYAVVAHIDRRREVTYREDVPAEVRETIEQIAATADPEVSVTQAQTVFDERPVEP